MSWTPEQLKIIEALRDKITALCGTASRLPDGIGICGFVFQPHTGFVIHYGNVKFPAPHQLQVLHEILSIACLRADQDKQQVTIPEDFTDIQGGTSSELGWEPEAGINKFKLADELAKLVLMLPPGETSTEVVAAAQSYISESTKKDGDRE